jgi:hypothetical protein
MIPMGEGSQGGVREAAVSARKLAGVEVLLGALSACAPFRAMWRQLRKERDQAQRRIEQLDEALKALSGLGGVRSAAASRGHTQISGATRSTMSH